MIYKFRNKENNCDLEILGNQYYQKCGLHPAGYFMQSNIHDRFRLLLQHFRASFGLCASDRPMKKQSKNINVRLNTYDQILMYVSDGEFCEYLLFYSLCILLIMRQERRSKAREKYVQGSEKGNGAYEFVFLLAFVIFPSVFI